jgi:very-short-patch-repair endonuclease
MTLRLKSIAALQRLSVRLSAEQRKVLKTARPAAPALSPPQQALWQLVSTDFPAAESEYRGAVADRRFRIDIALPLIRLAVEVDGWQHHGKDKSDFLRDREKDCAVLLAGWRVARFTAGEIIKDPELVRSTLAAIVRAVGGPERPI